MNAPVAFVRRYGRAADSSSAIAFRTLLTREMLRFWKVSFQTIAAPVLTAVLYLLVFGQVLADHVEVFPGVSYVAFLIPGLVMMSVLQNAFANSSSSLIQSKIMGSLVFVLLPPFSHWQLFGAYVLASVVRGLVVGLGVFVVAVWFGPPSFEAPLWILVFALAGSAMLGALGVIAGIWADKFDQLAAFQNFVVMPATFLSGVFYSVHGLAGVLAGRVAPQSVFLHDRRLPLRLLRAVRRVAVGEPGRGGRCAAAYGRDRAAPAGARLQAEALSGP